MTEKNNENFLSKQEERQGKIEKIVNDNQMREVISHAEMGDAAAIFARFAYVEPEKGGYSDISADKDLFEHASMLIDEKLEEGAENSWGLYESIGNEIRDQYGDDEDYKLYKSPPASVEDKLQEQRSSAIEEIAFSRGQRQEV